MASRPPGAARTNTVEQQAQGASRPVGAQGHDAGLDPDSAARAFASGAEGVVLSEVLLGLDEIALPAPMMERLKRLDGGSFHVVNGFQIAASPLSPVLRRLLDGEGYWDLAANWFSDGDLSRVAWPVGLSVSCPYPIR